jgi:hypothetical protein
MMESDPSRLSLESTLERNFPGLAVLDRDLELSERFRADLVAVERSGRLVLVLLVETEGDEPLLASLEALAFARHNAPVLGAHFGEPRLRTDQPPRVLLIAHAFPPALVARLRPLLDRSVELFEVRQVKSARGENLYLASVGGEAQVLAAAAGSEDAFFQRLGPDQEALAKRCLERVARIDDELRVASTSARVTWSFRGAELARLEVSADLLSGSVAPNHDARVLRSPAQVDFFADEVLGRYVELLGAPGAAPGGPESESFEPGSEEGNDPLGAFGPLGGGNDFDGDDPDDAAGRPRPLEPTGFLTPDELRAFQE